MADFGEYSNKIKGINLSRNTPVALIFGVAGFIGSHLSDELLKKDIQVVGVDNFSGGSKINLEESIRSNKFHLINRSILDTLDLDLPRLDYAFFCAEDKHQSKLLYKEGLKNFLELCAGLNSKIVFVSSIELYNTPIKREYIPLKNAEIELAKFSKPKKLNARIIRLSSCFGPRMNFRDTDPVTRLIQASLSGDLQKEQTSMDFSTRSLYIADAVDLIIKTALSGSTAQKIYDGCAIYPVKVSEVKQILLDPLWYEQKGFRATELPPWNTPNLKRTTSELSWRSKKGIVEALKETVSYFKESGVVVPKLTPEELEDEVKEWRGELPKVETDKSQVKGKSLAEELRGDKPTKIRNNPLIKINKEKVVTFAALGLILLALVFPIVSLGWGVWSIRSDLQSSSDYLKVGDFNMALEQAGQAKTSVSELDDTVSLLGVFQRVNLFSTQIDQIRGITADTKVAIDGVSHAIDGASKLFDASAVITGEKNTDPTPLYAEANSELSSASDSLSGVVASLADPSSDSSLPFFIRSRVDDLRNKVGEYSKIVSEAQAASNLLPSFTALNSKKSYLVLLSDNLTLRGSGGVVKSYAILDFEGGKLKDIKVDDNSTIDVNLQGQITPATYLKSDLNAQNYTLGDSLFESDYPTAAKISELIYQNSGGGGIDGVISLDLDSLSSLLGVTGGVNLPDYNSNTTSSSLIQGYLSHPSIPGKKGFLTETLEAVLNKAFFSSNQNYPKLLGVMSDSLSSKHLLVYLDQPSDLSYLLSQNWAGVVSRGGSTVAGQVDDFLGLVDSNMSQDDSNPYIKESSSLETSIGGDGLILNHLMVSYQSSSKSDYKDRVRVYLPAGANLSKALWGETDITKDFSSASDYSRAVYSDLITLNQGDSKTLVLDYSLPSKLSFGNSVAGYSLYVSKQAGQETYPFNWQVTYPNNFKATPEDGGQIASGKQEIDFKVDLSEDKLLRIHFAN